MSVRWAAVTLIATVLLVPATGRAQTPPCDPPANANQAPCKEPTPAERWTARYRALHLKGITPKLGSIVPGSSFSAGVELRRDRLFGVPVGASFETMWSIRGYHEYDVRIGRIRGDHYRAALRPLDADVTSVFSDGALLAKGVAAYVDLQHRVYPRVDFFGLGQQSNVHDRTDYGFVGSTVDAVVQWQHDRHFGASARFGVSRLRLDEGTNRGVPNLETRYTAESAPGLDLQPRYRSLGLSTILDYRDTAQLTSTGSWAGVALWKAWPRDKNVQGGFTRLVADVRHFRSLPDKKHVLALRALLSTRVGSSDAPTPFYLQPTLGGSRTLRGMGSYRLRGDALWAATMEYRWQVHRFIEVAPFLDIGAVATRFTDLRDSGAAVTPGIGVRARTSERVVGRLDYATGRDGQRVVMTLSAPF